MYKTPSLPEQLIKKLLFTILCIAVFRFGCQVALPGVDSIALSSTEASGLVELFNRFSGGALSRFSIFALGVVPYVTTSIVVSLLGISFAQVAEMQKDSAGRKLLSQYTRYASLLLASFQAFGLAKYLLTLKSATGVLVVNIESSYFVPLTVLTLVAGSIFVMWLGERISERGLGNGTSVIIFSGIASGIPSGVVSLYKFTLSGELSIVNLLELFLIIALAFYAIVFIEKSIRKVPVHSTKKAGVIPDLDTAKLMATNFLPIKINVAGIMPPIFASALLTIPGIVLDLLGRFGTGQGNVLTYASALFYPGSIGYYLFFAVMIIAFTYMYSTLQIRPKDLSESLLKNGTYFPGVRPGASTENYIVSLLNRLSLLGAFYICSICLLPAVITSSLKFPLYFGGTTLLILIGVAIDMLSQIEGFYISRQYESLTKVKPAAVRTGNSKNPYRRF